MTSFALMSALERRAKQARLSRFRYFGVAAVPSRRPETYLRGDSTRVVVRRVKRFTPDACRAVAVHRNATDCVEARRRDLTFPQPRAIVLPPPMVWRGTLCSLRQDRADGCLLSFKPSRLAGGCFSNCRLSCFRG